MNYYRRPCANYGSGRGDVSLGNFKLSHSIVDSVVHVCDLEYSEVDGGSIMARADCL